MNNERHIKTLLAIHAMPERNATEKARKANAFRHLANAGKDDGAYGRIDEILSLSVRSIRTNFAKQGKADCFVYVDGKRYNAERKTNGGRIGSLYGKKAPKFVVYSMDICNAGTNNARRVIEPIVMRTEKFLAILEECHATKNTNGKNPEIAIQASSKVLFMALSEYSLAYDASIRYTADDFED